MTMTDRSTVVGVFELRSEADAAIYELQRAGFTDDQIGFIVRNEDAGAATTVEDGNTTEAAPGAAVGAVSGGIIGGVIGAAAALLIPGIGPVIAGGILVTVLGGAAIGAGIYGASVGPCLGFIRTQNQWDTSSFSAAKHRKQTCPRRSHLHRQLIR